MSKILVVDDELNICELLKLYLENEGYTVFTANEALAGKFARELECGGVFINGFSASDARVAFGGVKKSGFGRELSHFGLHEFCNVQTVWRNRV